MELLLACALALTLVTPDLTRAEMDRVLNGEVLVRSEAAETPSGKAAGYGIGAIAVDRSVEQTWKVLQPHLAALQSGDFGGKEFGDWLVEIGVQELTDPWDEIIWQRSEEAGDMGLLASWPAYARKYPERCVAAGV